MERARASTGHFMSAKRKRQCERHSKRKILCSPMVEMRDDSNSETESRTSDLNGKVGDDSVSENILFFRGTESLNWNNCQNR